MEKEKTGFMGWVKRKKWLIAVILIIILAGGYGVANAMKPLEINAEAIAKGTFLKTVEDVAYVSDANQYELFSQNGGEVSKVYIKAGETVKTGQIVLELKNPQATSQVSQIDVQMSQINGQITAQNTVVAAAKTALDAAQKERDRCRGLFEEGGISQVEMDAADQAYQVALETYNGAKSTLAALNSQKAAIGNMLNIQENISRELVVKSPKNGILLDMPWEVGQIVSPGQLLLTVGEGNKMTIKADYLADDTVDMAIGQKVIITSPVLPEEGILGTISNIDPIAFEKISALGIAQRRIGVKIDAPPVKGIKPGFEVRAAVVIQEIDDAIVLSQALIHQSGDRNMVWLVVDGKLHEKEVQIQNQNSKQAVVSGVKEGDMLATAVPDSAKEGVKVKIAE